MPDPAQQLVARFAAVIDGGAFTPGGPPASGPLAQLWTTLEQRLADDRLGAATLLLFTSDPSSADLQARLAQALAQHLAPTELQAMLITLQGDAPSVRARISAAEDALIQGSGHKVLAPPGPVDLETSAGQRGRIIDSPITIVGSGGPTSSAAPAPRPAPLPATLSADGVHFSYGHALIIGVGQYRDPSIATVASTANDARALAELLRDPQLAAYPASQVRVLVDAKATRTNILDALGELAQRAADGTALIFFAGHGTSLPDQPLPMGTSASHHGSLPDRDLSAIGYRLSAMNYALLPFDTEVARLAETGIDAELFHRCVARVREKARRLVVLLNCCHAGGVGDQVLGNQAETLSGTAPPPEFYRPLAMSSGQVVISSSRPAQKSGAVSRRSPQHTTFGAQLLAALRGAAPGAGPALGVFELFAALRASVPADARHINYQGAPLVQEPLFYASQLDDNLAVALRPAGAGATLGANAALVERLVGLELQIEGRGADAPAELLAERDRLLAEFE
jgi:hypothetical protein